MTFWRILRKFSKSNEFVVWELAIWEFSPFEYQTSCSELVSVIEISIKSKGKRNRIVSLAGLIKWWLLWGFRGCCAEVPGLPRLVPGCSRAFWWVLLTRRAYSCIGSRVIRGQCWASWKFEKLWPLGEFCENIWKVMNSLSLRVWSDNFPRSNIKNHAQNWSRLLK